MVPPLTPDETEVARRLWDDVVMDKPAASQQFDTIPKNIRLAFWNAIVEALQRNQEPDRETPFG